MTGDLSLAALKKWWIHDLCSDSDPRDSARDLKDHLACQGNYGDALVVKKRVTGILAKAWNLVDPAKYYKRLLRQSPGDLRLASIADEVTTDKWIYACVSDAELNGLNKAHFIEACALQGRAVRVYRNRSKPGLVIAEIGRDEVNAGYGPSIR